MIFDNVKNKDRYKSVPYIGEAHCPGVIAAAEGAPERVEKIVFKIKID
ncbi:MAG: hypothetical protein IJR90_08125 [Clostridia bacterium]|nr:hypothetical protein [Clostridia bacterium]